MLKITNKCQNCINYKITWDKNFPYSCKALEFKSKKNPSKVVSEASGENCMFFKPKKKIKEDLEYEN